jgi:hypothetical protein
LSVEWSNEDSVFIINQSADPFPLALLRLAEKDEKDDILGAAWGVQSHLLQNGECVAAWKEDANVGKIKMPDCVLAGTAVTRPKPDVFWKKDVHIYYGEQLIDTCKEKDKACEIVILQ